MAVAASQLTPQEFEKFQAIIFKLSGIRVPENKVTLLSNRIRRRLRATKITDFQSYLRHLRHAAGKAELEGFLSAVTTNETSFFRTDKHFDWLRDGVLSSRFASRRVSASTPSECGSGQRPAVRVRSPIRSRCAWPRATCTQRAGRSRSWARISANRRSKRPGPESMGPPDVDKLSRKAANRCTSATANGSTTWEVSPALKEMVTLLRHNLMDSLPQPAFDCVFVRNVLIYFNRESKQTVIDHVVRSMADGGYLVVGTLRGDFRHAWNAAETIRRFSTRKCDRRLPANDESTRTSR